MCSRQDLAEEGNSMGVRMGSLAQVNTALTSAQAWAKSAAAASAPSTSKAPYSRRPPIAQASLPSTILQPPLLHFARSNLFGSRLDQGQLLRGKFVVSQVEKLLVAYEEMAVELPEATDLKARNQQALAWVEEAHKHLSAEETPTEEHAPILEVRLPQISSTFELVCVPFLCSTMSEYIRDTGWWGINHAFPGEAILDGPPETQIFEFSVAILQDLVDKGMEIGLVIPELSTARDRLAALQWAARARALLAATEPLPPPQLPPPSTPTAACPTPAPAPVSPPTQPSSGAAADAAALPQSAEPSGAASPLPPPQPLPAAATEPASAPADQGAPGSAAAMEVAQHAEAGTSEPPYVTEGLAVGTDVLMAEAGEPPLPSQADGAAAPQQPETSGRAAEQVPPATPARDVGATPKGGLEGVAGSAIFTKVSPMKLGPNGKASPFLSIACHPSILHLLDGKPKTAFGTHNTSSIMWEGVGLLF